MSVVLATALIPILYSRGSAARIGLRRTLVAMLTFNFVYMLAVIFVYPRICW
jgi:hypothetical protein